MAAPTKYPSPLQQMHELAIEARAAGLDFDQWWEQAIRPGRTIVMVTTKNPPAGAVLWPTDRNDRVTWMGAIEDSKEGWRRAYVKAPPTIHEAALRLLAPGLAALDEVAEELYEADERPIAA